ncbi:MAG: RNA-guided endonuclease TnpB family protein [Candidatus Desulfaltia sp.]|nr:RNA-guided endonuclease TnpB family protein [Candidatus Desulfaltia sp.]
MLLGQKIEIRPNAKQEEYFLKSVGIKRFVWNNCLSEWSDAYKRGYKPDEIYIQFFYKCLRERNTWIDEVSARIGRGAVDDLLLAFQRFFKKQSEYPKFKKRGVHDSFSIREKEKFSINGRKLKIEKLKTKINMRQKPRFEGIQKQITISCKGGKWFASILTDTSKNPFIDKVPAENQGGVGIDMGIKHFAALSDGTIYEANQPLKKKLKKLAKLQRSLARKQRLSNRWHKVKEKIAKLYYYITCKRQAVLHEFTDYITKTYKLIVIEDLNISGMSKNHHLTRAILDVGMSELRRQLEYKSKFRGCELVIADRWFASSKICSQCGLKKDVLSLAERTFICSNGCISLSRDKNAAKNLLNYGRDWIERDQKRMPELSKCA